MNALNDIWSFVQANMTWILIGIGMFLSYRWLRDRNAAAAPGTVSASSIPQDLFGSVATGAAMVAIVAILAVTVIAVIKPSVVTGILGPGGPFAAGQQADWAKASLYSAAIDPNNPEKNWVGESVPVAAAREALASEYQLATAKNKTGMSQAAAEAACYLPKGHPQRALWDSAGIDPCESSVPAGIQASARAVAKTTGEVAGNTGDALAKIDLTSVDKSLSAPVGLAPASADPLVKSTYDLPKGAVLFAGLLGLIFVLGLAIKLVR